MKIIIAPDSFKGSLSSIEVIQAIKEVAVKTFADVEVIGIPIADGGEGTIEATLFESEGITKSINVNNPLGNLIEAEYGIIGDTAILEMAACSGLPLVPDDKRNPLKTTSIGTGQMIKHVLDEGLRKILIGIGGSATNDGGMGAMQALGAKFYDSDNRLIKIGCGENLIKVNKICLDNLDKRLSECDISVMCDVTNPLTGSKGATYVYGQQKGGTKESLAILEKGMLHYEVIINELFKKDISKQAGSGAAGGMGAALLGFCNAKLVRGIDAVLELKSFREQIKGADLIITGEGRVDEQSAFGKVVHGVTVYANDANVPVVVIAGGLGDGFESVYDIGVKAVFAIPNRPMSLENCMKESNKLIQETTKNIFAIINMINNK